MQTLVAQKRDILGKKVKSLRKDGFMPAVLYGKQKESTSIAVKERDFMKVWKSAGRSTIIHLEFEKPRRAVGAPTSLLENMSGASGENVLIHDIAFDPIKDNPIHADFLVVAMDKPIKVDVKINFVGESSAIKAGGSLVKILHELHIEALPKNLPQEIEIDISLLAEMKSSIKVGDIKPKDFSILNNPNDIIVLVEAPKTEEELKAEEEATAVKSIETIEVVGKKEKEVATPEEGVRSDSETRREPRPESGREEKPKS